MGVTLCPAAPWHPTFWRAYAITLRPYLSFVSGAAGLVGLALAASPHGVPLGAAAAAFLASYGFGQALTDVFQVDTDALSSPYRPLPRGEVSRGAVAAVSLAGLAACGAILCAQNAWNGVLAAACVAGLVAYTPMKRRYWAGPPWNAGIVTLLVPMGLLCGGGSARDALAHPLLLPAAASVFFSYAIFVLLGYLKDVEADRRTGYDTLPVRFGRRAAVAVSAVLLAATAVASRALVGAALASAHSATAVVAGLAFWAAGLALLGLGHLRLLPATRDDEAHRGIVPVVAGYVALHFGEAILLRPALLSALPALYAAFLAALARRPCREQI